MAVCQFYVDLKFTSQKLQITGGRKKKLQFDEWK